nr:hypothetical protein [Tanacetum cinerariifolium]
MTTPCPIPFSTTTQRAKVFNLFVIISNYNDEITTLPIRPAPPSPDFTPALYSYQLDSGDDSSDEDLSDIAESLHTQSISTSVVHPSPMMTSNNVIIIASFILLIIEHWAKDGEKDTLKNSSPLPDFEEYVVSTSADTSCMILWSNIKKNTFSANTLCGYLVDGPNCQGCALLRQELEENLVTHSLDFHNTSEPSNASTNVVNAPREPYVGKQDHGSFVDNIIFDLNRAPDLPNQFHCFHCKDALRDGEACKRCTYAKCGSVLSKGLCYVCGHN